MTKPKTPKPKRAIRSFEVVDARTARLLELAIESTGKSQTEIMNEALNRYLGPLVKDIEQERLKALRQFKAEWEKRDS